MITNRFCHNNERRATCFMQPDNIMDKYAVEKDVNVVGHLIILIINLSLNYYIFATSSVSQFSMLQPLS